MKLVSKSGVEIIPLQHCSALIRLVEEMGLFYRLKTPDRYVDARKKADSQTGGMKTPS